MQANDPTSIELADLDLMTGTEFEAFVAALFLAPGREVARTKATRDHGADLVLTEGGERSLVQVKRYCGSVSNGAVQEAVAAKAMYQATHAWVVTTGTFTSPAEELAAANGVELVGRERLRECLRRGMPPARRGGGRGSGSN